MPQNLLLIHKFVCKIKSHEHKIVNGQIFEKAAKLLNFFVDKRPGDWFGPSSTAHLLKDAVNDLSPSSSAISNPLLGELCVYVAQDYTVYTGDVLATASKR